MQSRSNDFVFFANFNFATQSVFITQNPDEGGVFPPTSNYLITQDTNFLITQDNNDLIAQM